MFTIDCYSMTFCFVDLNSFLYASASVLFFSLLYRGFTDTQEEQEYVCKAAASYAEESSH